MKFATNHFVVAGIVGAVTASGAIAASTASNAAPSAAGGSTTAAASSSVAAPSTAAPIEDQLIVHIAPGTCTATDQAQHRQTSIVTITVLKDERYSTSVRIDNLQSLGGAAPNGLQTYVSSDLGWMRPGQTRSTTVSWPASVTHAWLNTELGPQKYAAPIGKSFELGGKGLAGYSTVCSSGASKQPTAEPTNEPTNQPTNEPPTPSPATTTLGVTG